MTDKEFIKFLGKDFQECLKQANSKETGFVLNEKQFENAKRFTSFLKYLVDENGGKLEPAEFDPYLHFVGIGAYIDCNFSLNGEDAVIVLKDALEGVSAFGVDPTTDGNLYIDATIPNIFEEKNK